MLHPKPRTASTIALLILCASAGAIWAGETVRLDFSPPPLFEILGKQEKMRLICPRSETPPEIDGVLNDAAWGQAVEMPRLAEEGPMTRVLLCFDEKAVYVAFQCAEQPGRQPVAQKADRDWRPWDDDFVELWFNPGFKKGQSYRFVVNPAGTIYDAIMKNRARYVEYNPKWSVEVRRTAEMWTVEAAVPLKALELSGWPGVMGFNVGRTMPGLLTCSWVDPVSDTERGCLAFGRSRAEREEPARGGPGRRQAPLRPLLLEFERTFLRPGERWIEGAVRVRPDRSPLRNMNVRARLFPIGATKHVGEAAIVPARGTGRLFVDLQSHGLDQARVIVELFEGDRRSDVAEELLTVQTPEQSLREGLRIPITIDLPPGVEKVEDWPIHFGIAFARGALWTPNRVRLVDKAGQEIPSQREVTGRWAPDGAIKWLRFDALMSSGNNYDIEVAPSANVAQPRHPVGVREDGDGVILDTGVATYRLGKGPSPIRQVALGGRTVVFGAGARGLYVIDQKDRLASASADGETMTVEAAGPVAACVRFEGEYRTAEGESLARHITRVEAFAGQPFARVTHSLVLSRDSNQVWFKDIGWELKAAPGARPEAVFGISHENWVEALARPVGEAAVYMMQDDHFALGSGTNHLLVAAEDGEDTPYLEGEECGDWAALLGQDAGFLVSCRDAALQHPKEFLIGRDRVLLRFFSGRHDAELDFRAPSLVKRWRLADWYKRIRKDPAKIPDLVKQVSAFSSNAIGWAKTHHVLFCPVAPRTPSATLARASRLHSRDVFALPDSTYLCGTRVFGDLHPRDPERFPVLEALIDQPLDKLMTGVRGWDLGFVDYYAGPHYQGSNLRRYSITYTLRGNLWQTYARTGRRSLREFLARSEQSFLDNYYCHWDGAGKVRGLRVMQGGDSWYGTGKGALPMYWDGFPVFGVGGTTNRQNFIWMYQLTGERRARDGMTEFIDGAERYWTPSRARHCWRQIKAMMVLMQAYAFTWDPTLKAMADATADTFIDPECDLGLTKNRPYRSSTYKLPGDLPALIDAWEITGSPRYHDLARRSAEWHWHALLGYQPIHHSNTFARTGSFLYRESRDPSIPQVLAIQLSRLRAGYWDPEKREVSRGYGASGVTFIYEGIPYSQKLLLESGAYEDVVAAWAGFKMLRDPVSIMVQKAEDRPLQVHLRRFGGNPDTGAAGGTRLRPIGLTQRLGQNLNRVIDTSNDFSEVRIPKDSEGAAYEIISSGCDEVLAVVHSRTPLVIYAPGYWQPWPEQSPPTRYYFRLDKADRDAQVFFETAGRVFDPDGKPLQDGKLVRGWVALPADRPGMWSFESPENQFVRLRNAGPFFSVGAPDLYFTPDIPWERKEGQADLSLKPPPETLYIPGAVRANGNQALQLRAGRRLALEAGPDRPSKDGGRFLPHHSGTIEFFMKPNWGTFTLPAKCRVYLLSMTAEGPGWSLNYSKNPNPAATYPAHSLYGLFWREVAASKMRVMAYHRTILEPDEWVHIAWVWGLRETATHRGRKRWLVSQLFMNGKAGRPSFARQEEPTPYAPLKLLLGGHVNMAVDELRISDIQRYTHDFTPPSRHSERAMDEHTRALFHFNGDLQGRSAGYDGEMPARLVKP